MNIRTESEILFERFCSETCVSYTRIPPEPRFGRRTPDYELHVQVPSLLAEVKQIDPNAEDKVVFRKFQETGVLEFEGIPGKRLRNKISEAASQLKARVGQNQPTLLVVYNNVDVLQGFTGPDAMMSAMYGLYEVTLIKTSRPRRQVLGASHRLGGKRKLTPEHNTTLSAVAALFEWPEGPYLVLYHNKFAANPISPEVLRRPRIYQRAICETGNGEFPKWIDL